MDEFDQAIAAVSKLFVSEKIVFDGDKWCALRPS